MAEYSTVSATEKIVCMYGELLLQLNVGIIHIFEVVVVKDFYI